jgi:nitrate reductase gamma subunit
MAAFLYGLLYAGGIVFLAGCITRAVRYAKEPIHLRWEIYPVPHSRSGELKVMIPEILLLKGLWDFNRPMWYVSYPFHLGLYLLSASVVLAVGGPIWPGGLSALAHSAAVIGGTAGATLGLLGSLGLLLRRLTSQALRIYNTGGDFFNLIFFTATLSLLLAGYWLRPAGSPGPAAILRAAAVFDTALQPSPVLAAGLGAGALLLAYIPMTHMAHFIAKYFTYHSVRWDERSNVAGGTIQKKMAEYLMYRPTWAAPHVGADGSRTWVDIATTNPTKGGAK